MEQTDIHSPSITVEESLLFSARLRLDESIPMQQVHEIVQATLQTIELTNLKGVIVGELGSGLSTPEATTAAAVASPAAALLTFAAAAPAQPTSAEVTPAAAPAYTLRSVGTSASPVSSACCSLAARPMHLSARARSARISRAAACARVM